MATNISIIIVEKIGSLKLLTVKDFKEEELYKKCGFKKPDHFGIQTEWSAKVDGSKYYVSLYGKTEGKANTENKYDFPPPVDSTLFFGNCVLVCRLLDSVTKEKKLMSITLQQWDKIYEKLFGGFEDLSATAQEDELEIDELDGIPASKKTKDGYLKDGFVVDSESDSQDDGGDDDDEDEDESEEPSEEEELGGLELEDIGSELSEEEYDYSDDDGSGDDDGVMGASTIFSCLSTNATTTTKKKKD